MKVFYSWSSINNQYFIAEPIINLFKLSLALCKQHYNDVSLITDDIGYESLKSLPFDNIYISLNNLPKHRTIWSLGKIYAYQYACLFNESFLHLDADVLLWEKLPQTLLSEKIFCQSEDELIGTNLYDINNLSKISNTIVPEIWKKNIGLMTYNLGIFGGSNLDIINYYTNLVIDMIHNDKYAALWKYEQKLYKNIFNTDTSKSVLIEQANFSIMCKYLNIQPQLLFKDIKDINNVTYQKYTHLMNKKNDLKIIKKIKQRLSTDPYNLTPNAVSIDNWHN